MAIIVLNAKPKPAKSKQIQGKGIKAPKRIEWEYRKQLFDMINPYMGQLELFVESIENPDIILTPAEASNEIDNLKKRWDFQFDTAAKGIATKWTRDVNKWNKAKTSESIAKVIGVDVAPILQEDAIKESLDIAMLESEELIKTIPNKTLGQVTDRIIQHFKGIPMPEGRTLTQQIQEEFKITYERAKVIARDQTSKMNGNISQIRQSSLGIKVYIWRTSADNRVVGKPGGLYPKPTKLHRNHYEMEGMYCRWDDPNLYSKDGKEWKQRTATMPKNHPGEDINCRCFARPVIDIENLRTRWE